MTRNIKTDPDKKDLEQIFTLIKSGKFKDAEKEVDKKLSIFPESSILYNIYGASLAGQNQFSIAIEKYKKSISLNPNYAEAYNNLGISLEKLKNYEESIKSFEKAILLKKNFPEAIKNLSILCNNYGNLLSKSGEFEKAHKNYLRCIELRADYEIAYSNLLFNLNFIINLDQSLYLYWAKKFRQNCKKTNLKINYNYEKNPKKLKIGFVSSDFGHHPGGYFSFSTLNNLSNDFELVAYSNFNREDDLSDKFKKLFHKWNLIDKKSDEEVVKQIQKDKIHILIDMQGHSAKNRLPIFFYKAAPIQITWLGQGTSGISEIDYFIGSKILNPECEDKFYVEKVLRLPKISQCLTPPEYKIDILDLPAKKNRFFTFGCFNQSAKINEEVISLWSKILASVKSSKLLLKSADYNNNQISKNILDKFNKFNIDNNRIILKGGSKTRKEVLETYNSIDISLDTFPFQGNTTTCESYWMGVPVITLRGNRHLFHFGESINSNLNMKDWIADNEHDYLKKAIEFSSDVNKISKIRINLRKEIISSPVFNSRIFSKNFDKLLWDTWKKFKKVKC